MHAVHKITCGDGERTRCVRGYHVYRTIWAVVVGKELACERESTDVSDSYAVAGKKNLSKIISILKKKNFVTSKRAMV